MQLSKSLFSTLAFTVALGISSNDASATERQFSFGLISTPDASHDIGGFNSNGGFTNADDRNSSVNGLYIAYGAKDLFQLGNTPITVEAELAVTNSDVVTNSFPGAPGPILFFYNTHINSQRLSANLWAPIWRQSDWMLEGGAGLGVQAFNIRVSDGVVTGNSSDYVMYGMLGLKMSKEITESSGLELGLRYSDTGTANIPLDAGASGNYEYSQSGLSVLLGWRLDM